MDRIKQWRNAILATLGAAGIWLAAVLAFQPTVTPPAIPIWHSGIHEWIVTNDYQTAQTVAGVTYTTTIRAGFKSDGASIPDSLAAALGIGRNHPAVIRGALIHDALYAANLLDRQTADSILYAACLQDGTDPDKARAIWKAVNEWGFIAWERTPNSITEARKLVSVTERKQL
jgi:hypothetical protein